MCWSMHLLQAAPPIASSHRPRLLAPSLFLPDLSDLVSSAVPLLSAHQGIWRTLAPPKPGQPTSNLFPHPELALTFDSNSHLEQFPFLGLYLSPRGDSVSLVASCEGLYQKPFES